MAEQENKIAVLYTTAPTLSEAKLLARAAVEAKYAACVNIIPVIESVYSYEGAIHEGQECALIFKTTHANAKRLEQLLQDKHPYTLPALLTFQGDASSDFYRYVSGFVGKNSPCKNS